jgi:arylsulfatase A-like enzyme
MDSHDAMTTSRPTNVLWICTDSQRWDTLGCLGNPHVRTPRLDRLASEGALCSHAFVQSPVCTPSRGSFLSGRYPVTNRLRQNGANAPADLRIVPRMLADAGYVCGLSGKLHLSACDNRLLLGDEWWRHDEQEFFRGVEPRIEDGYHEFWWDHAPSGKNPSSAYLRWLAERGIPAPAQEASPHSRFIDAGMPSEHHQARWCVDKAIGFLDAHRAQPHPWLFSVNIFDPHYPFNPPAAFLERFAGILDSLPLPDFSPDELLEKPASQRRWMEKAKRYAWSGMSDADRRWVRAAYWAMVEHIDLQVGRLLDALERSGQAEGTLVLFHSDHGELLGDHGIFTKGPMFYDGAVRVPLIARWPGRIPAGRRCDALVECIDLAPTVLDAAGLPIEPAMQGRSLLPLLTGTSDAGRDDVWCEYFNAMPGGEWASMVRTAERKLVKCHGGDDGELYDLVNDPHERRNLWRRPDWLEEKCRMLGRLADRLAFTADPLPPRIGIF